MKPNGGTGRAECRRTSRPTQAPLSRGRTRSQHSKPRTTDLKDKLLRTLADMENLRRRTEREVADARAYAVTNFARDMLTAADNRPPRARQRSGRGRATAEGALKGLIDGIDLTERDLLKTLGAPRREEARPAGPEFDPNLHQAMFEVPNPDVPTGTVLQVVQTGYAIGDRVLRPALVGVAKGGPKPSGNAADTEAAAGQA